MIKTRFIDVVSRGSSRSTAPSTANSTRDNRERGLENDGRDPLGSDTVGDDSTADAQYCCRYETK